MHSAHRVVICGVLEAAKHGQADADLSGKGSTVPGQLGQLRQLGQLNTGSARWHGGGMSRHMGHEDKTRHGPP